MRILLSTYFTFIVILVASFHALPQNAVVLTDPSSVYRIDASTEFLLDKKKVLRFEDIIGPAHQPKFQKADNDLTFGYTPANIWLRVRLTTTLPKNQWYLEIPAPYIEYVDFYQTNGPNWSHAQSGYFRPHRIREVFHTGHVLPLSFRGDSTTTVYILISGESPKTFPLLVSDNDRFLRTARMEDVGYGIFFGTLFVMFFYNLFISFALRNINYLIYIFTIICTFLIFSSATGYAGMYLWPENPRLNFYGGRMTLPVQIIAVSIFTISFLQVKRYSTWMYYVLVSLIPLSLIAGILVLTGIQYSAGNNLISIGTIVFMTAGIVCRIRGNVTANYFIAAWAVYFSGGLFLTLRNSGVLPYGFLTTHLVEIGAALETVIIAFALAARYRRLRIEKEEAQAMALKVQLDATEKLEAKVAERTEQLSMLNENLREMLKTNRDQTRIIEEKNAELDSFFYRISHDLKGPISSLRGLTLLARMDVSDATALDYLTKQQQQIERLDLIIHGLINLTRLNRTELEKTRIDFVRLVDECILSLQGLPSFRDITFHREIQEGLEFESEWTLLNAIIQNLVENSIKYRRDEDPFVRIRIFGEDSSVVIEVEDNGQGIAPEHHSRIYDMFYRATHHAGGTGLGLYILKRSVDKLQGTITTRSEENVGSTFTVRLPADPA